MAPREGVANAGNGSSLSKKKAKSAKELSSSEKRRKQMKEQSKSNKSFKSFRKVGKSLKGALTGESRKQRKARKAAERAAAKAAGQQPNSTLDEEDDEETVYGVNIDASDHIPAVPSLLTPTKQDDHDNDEDNPDAAYLSPIPNTESEVDDDEDALQLVLLLMDPNSRRFELLQLEFDSKKAIVSDVLDQVKLSVTEETLRKQEYVGVCDRFGTEMINSLPVSGFCSSNEIVLAMPEGVPSKECARLAKPILNDPKVKTMLKSSGIDCDMSFTPSHVTKKRSRASKGGGKNALRGLMQLAFVVGLLALLQQRITAPIQAGDVLTPGTWRSKCGLLPAVLCNESAGLEMGRDGVLTKYGADGKVAWRMEGDVCDKEDDPSCVDGLVISDNGDLMIGGKSVKSYTVVGDASPDLSPWPFVEAPKLRMTKSRK